MTSGSADTYMESPADGGSQLTATDAIQSMGRLLRQRIDCEVQEYTAVLERLLLDIQRSPPTAASSPQLPPLQQSLLDTAAHSSLDLLQSDAPADEHLCATKLLKMHVLMNAIGAQLDRAAEHQ